MSRSDANVQVPHKPADAKRGFVPSDEKNFSPSALETLRTAAKHISYLVNEGYDIKSASTFVGNHFSLSERQRLALVRSISTTGQLDKRRAKEVASLSGREVWIDGFNTVITLEVMLCNSILFDCMDGCIRDLAAMRGTYRIIPETEYAIKMLFSALTKMNVNSAHILLDEPVSNSGRLKALLADIKEEQDKCCPFSLDIQLLKDVDRELWTKENVITADAIILDHCISWFNLMAVCAKESGAKPLRAWA
ncbi:MAG: DUF434 domain-containing protein [Treponema sp.]|nr:DUF434 domain-containing protein [Treponema sp.]